MHAFVVQYLSNKKSENPSNIKNLSGNNVAFSASQYSSVYHSEFLVYTSL